MTIDKNTAIPVIYCWAHAIRITLFYAQFSFRAHARTQMHSIQIKRIHFAHLRSLLHKHDSNMTISTNFQWQSLAHFPPNFALFVLKNFGGVCVCMRFNVHIAQRHTIQLIYATFISLLHRPCAQNTHYLALSLLYSNNNLFAYYSVIIIRIWLLRGTGASEKDRINVWICYQRNSTQCESWFHLFSRKYIMELLYSLKFTQIVCSRLLHMNIYGAACRYDSLTIKIYPFMKRIKIYSTNSSQFIAKWECDVAKTLDACWFPSTTVIHIGNVFLKRHFFYYERYINYVLKKYSDLDYLLFSCWSF